MDGTQAMLDNWGKCPRCGKALKPVRNQKLAKKAYVIREQTEAYEFIERMHGKKAADAWLSTKRW